MESHLRVHKYLLQIIAQTGQEFSRYSYHSFKLFTFWLSCEANFEVEIPYRKLAPEVLQNVIEEFVTRDGTDYGEQEVSLEEKAQRVRKMLEEGSAILVFDSLTESCDIVLKAG